MLAVVSSNKPDTTPIALAMYHAKKQYRLILVIDSSVVVRRYRNAGHLLRYVL